MRRTFSYAILVIVGITLAAFTSCRTGGTPPTEIANTSQVTMGYAALRISLPVFVADDRKLFQKHGLSVKLQKYDTAQPMMDALVSGGIDVGGFCALPITFSAMARSKVDLLFLNALMEDQSHPVSMLIVRDDSGIQSIGDLANKRIGILPTRAYEVWMRTILAKNGVDANSVIIQQVPPSLQAEALVSGSIQALFTNDPGATSALARPGIRLLVKGAPVPHYIYEPFYFGSFNIRRDWAARNPETVVKISQALDEAIDILNTDQAYAKGLMAKYVDPKLAAVADRYPDSLYRKSNQVTNADLDKIYSYYLNSGIIASPLKLDSAQYHWQP